MVTPSQPRVTFPASRSWVRIGLARSIGMAKPTPWNPPLRVAMALAIPMTSPRVLISGPPELPGLIAASVWRKSSYRPAPMTRPVPLMMPTVTVWSSPNGFPIAITGSATLRLLEAPSGMLGSPLASIFRSARSVSGSLPTSLAEKLRPSDSVTSIDEAPSTT